MAILSDKEMNDLLVKEKIEQVQKQNQTIKEVNIFFDYLYRRSCLFLVKRKNPRFRSISHSIDQRISW